MKIMYIASLDFYAKPNPSYHLMTSMLTDLLENGFEITYIGISEKGIEKHIPDNLSSHVNFCSELVERKKVKKSHFVRRFLDGVGYSKQVLKIAKKVIDRIDLIFVQSSPTVYYTIKNIRKLTNKPIVYNVQDMFPGSSIASGVMKNVLLQKFFFHMQKKAYKMSDKIVAISNDMKNKLLKENVQESKIDVIVNWFDDSAIHEVDWNNNRFVKKYGLNPNNFYVQYAGTIGYVFDYKMVIEIAKRLFDNKDIVIQIIGMGSQKEEFISNAKSLNLNNICFLPLEPQEMVSDVYSACDVCLIPLKKGIIGNSVPSKAGLLMECKRAIVTSSDEGSEYNKMINNNRIGFAKATDDFDGVAESILYLRNNRMECKEMGRNGYNYGHILYARSTNMKKYINLFLSLVSK